MGAGACSMDGNVRERLQAAYDANAEARDRRDDPKWKRNVREVSLNALRRGGLNRLLEIGAGTGHDGVFFQQHGLAVVCVDLSPEMVRLCREKGLEAHVMDVMELRFPADSFDAAYSFNSLLHLPKAELPVALREVRRVLRPGGLFFLGLYGGHDHEGVWDEDTYEPKRFFSFHTDEDLFRTVEKAFDVVSFERIDVAAEDPHFHFQSLILRSGGRPAGPRAPRGGS
jgi:SAM-dependent methyltransferase